MTSLLDIANSLISDEIALLQTYVIESTLFQILNLLRITFSYTLMSSQETPQKLF